MNARTTTAGTRIILDANGAKFSTPAGFLLPSELPEGSARRIASERIIAAGKDGLDSATRSAFWMAAVSKDAETAPAAAPQTAPGEAYPNCLPPLTAAEVATLERIHAEAGRFRPVSKAVYCDLFKGAASSRRYGVPFHVWGERAMDAGYPRGLVALIALRAYSMDTAAVKGYNS